MLILSRIRQNINKKRQKKNVALITKGITLNFIAFIHFSLPSLDLPRPAGGRLDLLVEIVVRLYLRCSFVCVFSVFRLGSSSSFWMVAYPAGRLGGSFLTEKLWSAVVLPADGGVEFHQQSSIDKVVCRLALTNALMPVLDQLC